MVEGTPTTSMVTVKRPQRLFSFTDYQKTRPKEPPPGDRLDAMFMELASAIESTQQALAEIRRDDGKLQSETVTERHLVPGLIDNLIDDLKAKIAPTALATAGNAANAQNAERMAALYAADAERAVAVATQLVNGMTALRELITSKSGANDAASQVADMFATEAESWANLAHGMADNAIKAKDEALAWAEYLAGPVVNAAQAPAYIAGSPFPNGLYYQPIEGGVAGLFSAKWWALQAYNLVGAAGQFFLGPWPGPPLPGEQNPSTGQVAPNPIPPGSIYYDVTSGQVMVWNGTAWKTSVAPVSAVPQAQHVYVATANQQNFSGPDSNGQTPDVGDYPSDVYINGVRLVPTLDYTIDAGTDTLHINAPVTLNSIVQWDLLGAPPAAFAALRAWKIAALTPDGTTQDFPLKYVDASSATVDANVGSSAELLVSLDGALQEPGIDFTASGSAMHLAAVPPADGDLWAVWYQPEVTP